MINPTTYPYIRGCSFLQSQCQCISNPIIPWLAFGKLPQNITVTPSTSTQVITATAANRYLNSVTVLATTSSSDSTTDDTTS